MRPPELSEGVQYATGEKRTIIDCSRWKHRSVMDVSGGEVDVSDAIKNNIA